MKRTAVIIDATGKTETPCRFFPAKPVLSCGRSTPAGFAAAIKQRTIPIDGLSLLLMPFS